MALYFEEEGSLRLPLPCEELAREVVDAALDYVGCPYEAQVNLLLTTGRTDPRDEPAVPRDRPADRCAFLPHGGV